MPSAAGSEEVDPGRVQESSLGLIMGVSSTLHVVALIVVLSAGGAFICYLVQTQHGLGTHIEFVSKPDQLAYGAASFAMTIINIFGLALLKISLALSLLRLSTGKTFSRVLWATITFVALYSFFAWMALFLYCKPMEGFWNKSTKPSCYDIKLFIKFALVNTAFNIFTDVALASLPLIIVLGLGWIAVGLGVVKAIYQIQFANVVDKTFELNIQFWGFLQLNVGLIVACAPQLMKLLNPILKLSTERYYNPYRRRSRSLKNILGPDSLSGGYIKQESNGSHSLAQDDDLELNELPIIAMDACHASAHGGSAKDVEAGLAIPRKTLLRKHTVSQRSPTEPRPSDSDESIFGGVVVDPRTKGILRTTEVIVSSR
ncbi:Uu.00g083370.m01.CDS01 [Anthostomella pinea]|uniref:Uu.00g083370.m01.CDS01 n=1 Tax=Anthostomella pinea TaxID=933095 RepID=A0AAI8VMH1_9PEZI|nr:Uu.00g083370.m01.CDS01 [Anthostomella pinea]